MDEANARLLFTARDACAKAAKVEETAYDLTRYGHSEERAKHYLALEAYRQAKNHLDDAERQVAAQEATAIEQLNADVAAAQKGAGGA